MATSNSREFTTIQQTRETNDASFSMWREFWYGRNIAVVGDSRAYYIGRETPSWLVPHLVHFAKSGARMSEVLELADQVLNDHPNTDILILLGLHCDFTRMAPLLPRYKQTYMVPAYPDMDMLARQLRDYIEIWQKRFPFVTIVFTIPYIPDFYIYNARRAVSSPRFQEMISKERMFAYQQNYLQSIKSFLDAWFRHSKTKPFFMQSLKRRNLTGLHKKEEAEAYNGETTDGLHPTGETVLKFWPLVLRQCHHLMRNYEYHYKFLEPNKKKKGNYNNGHISSIENYPYSASLEDRCRSRGMDKEGERLQANTFQRGTAPPSSTFEEVPSSSWMQYEEVEEIVEEYNIEDSQIQHSESTRGCRNKFKDALTITIENPLQQNNEKCPEDRNARSDDSGIQAREQSSSGKMRRMLDEEVDRIVKKVRTEIQLQMIEKEPLIKEIASTVVDSVLNKITIDKD